MFSNSNQTELFENTDQTEPRIGWIFFSPENNAQGIRDRMITKPKIQRHKPKAKWKYNILQSRSTLSITNR